MKPSFYGEIQAQSYDVGDNPPEIIAFYLAEWERRGRPEPVLEPMCGTGLNLIPFLRAGAHCDGLDSSPFMLARCRAHLDRAKLHCTLFEHDLTTIDLPTPYRFIFIPGGSFGHLDRLDDAAQALQRLYMCLLPGGWLVFDVRPPQRISQFGTHQQVDQDRGEFSDGSTIVATGQWEHRDGGRVIRKVVNLERLHQGMRQGTEVFDYRERLYDQDELIIMLQAAGFHTIHVTKAYHHDQHPEPTDGFVVSCQRT